MSRFFFLLCLFSPLVGVEDLLTVFVLLVCSTPVGLQYEKFIIPDAVRILDAIIETLTY